MVNFRVGTFHRGHGENFKHLNSMDIRENITQCRSEMSLVTITCTIAAYNDKRSGFWTLD